MIGNHMISSTIWDRSSQTNFSNTKQIYNLQSSKDLRVLIYSKLQEKNHVITC